MWRTPQAKWIGIQYALYIGCSLFGVAYYYSFAQAMGLGTAAAVVGFAGFSLADGICLADLRLHLRVHRPPQNDDLRVLAATWCSSCSRSGPAKCTTRRCS